VPTRYHHIFCKLEVWRFERLCVFCTFNTQSSKTSVSSSFYRLWLFEEGHISHWVLKWVWLSNRIVTMETWNFYFPVVWLNFHIFSNAPRKCIFFVLSCRACPHGFTSLGYRLHDPGTCLHGAGRHLSDHRQSRLRPCEVRVLGTTEPKRRLIFSGVFLCNLVTHCICRFFPTNWGFSCTSFALARGLVIFGPFFSKDPTGFETKIDSLRIYRAFFFYNPHLALETPQKPAPFYIFVPIVVHHFFEFF